MKKTALILSILLTTTINAGEVNNEWQTINLNNLDDFPKDGSKLIDKDSNGQWTNFNDLVKQDNSSKPIEDTSNKTEHTLLKESKEKYPHVSEKKIKQLLLLVDNKEELFKILDTYQKTEEAF